MNEVCECGECHVLSIIEAESRRGRFLGLEPKQVADNVQGALFCSFLKDYRLDAAAAGAILGMDDACIGDLMSGRRHADEAMLGKLARAAPRSSVPS
jgi:hypothetical protein